MHEIGITYFIPMIVMLTTCECDKNLDKKLRHYDTLNVKDIRHKISRRSVENNPKRHVSFNSHGKQFNLELVEKNDFMASSLKTVTVDKDGKEHTFEVNRDSFYIGHVTDDSSTTDVTAHIDDDGLLTATIETTDETYVVEPMWRHVEKNSSHDMIVFKASDVIFDTKIQNTTRKCKYLANKNNKKDEKNSRNNENTPKVRQRRETSNCNNVMTNNTCSMMLVADYRFFRTIGRGSVATTAYHMFHTIQRVDRIFRRTCWTGVGKNIGVQVKAMKIYTEANSTGFNGPPKNDIWLDKTLLDAFDEEFQKESGNYCLLHLFTNVDLVGYSLGVAYQSSLCGILNVGLTTHTDQDLPLVRLQADLVTAHEIGHNFGASHDEDDAANQNCRKRNLMHEFSVTGAHIDNRYFSVCSQDDIGKHVKFYRGHCLRDENSVKCGNSVIDPGEECDPGPVSINDRCCTKDCRFRSKSNCSDYNHLCCQNCQIAPANVVCRDSSTIECKGEVKCTGKSFNCPPQAPKLNNNEECILNSTTDLKRKTTAAGVCRNGICESHCQNGTTPCFCRGINACKVCCKQKGSKCEPFRTPKGFYNELNGKSCLTLKDEEGLCMHGTCDPLKTDVRQKFNLELTLDNAINLMKNNIVLTIIMLSLLIWIPASCLVNYLDKEEDDALSERRSISYRSEQALKSPTTPVNTFPTLSVRRSLSTPNEPVLKSPATPMNNFPNVVSGQHIGFFRSKHS